MPRHRIRPGTAKFDHVRIGNRHRVKPGTESPTHEGAGPRPTKEQPVSRAKGAEASESDRPGPDHGADGQHSIEHERRILAEWCPELRPVVRVEAVKPGTQSLVRDDER
jgi:hypothetical protein